MFWAHFSSMPRGKQLDIVEKTKILAWFRGGVATKEIACRLTRDMSVVKKTIRENKALLPSATPPPPKKRSGRPSVATFREEERLRCYVLWYPFKTARELKKEVICWSDISVRKIQKICQKKLGLPSRCSAKNLLLTARMVKKKGRILQKVQVVD
jgi:hypothetical protein